MKTQKNTQQPYEGYYKEIVKKVVKLDEESNKLIHEIEKLFNNMVNSAKNHIEVMNAIDQGKKFGELEML